MPNQVAFLDTGFLINLAKIGQYISPETILNTIGANYDIHITNQVLTELSASNYGFNSTIQNWIQNTSNYTIDANPVTDALRGDGALTSNGGEFSIVEAAKNYSDPRVFVDDGFFEKVGSGESQLRDFIQNKQADSYQQIRDSFDSIYDRNAVSEWSQSSDMVRDAFIESRISDQAFSDSIKALEPTVSGLRGQAEAFVESIKSFLGDESGAVKFPGVEGAAAVRAFGQLLGAAGLGLAAYDFMTSTAKALGQLELGNVEGALATESAMLGRVLGGFWGAELGMGAALLIAGALLPPGAALEAAVLAGALIGSLLGMHAGEIYMRGMLELGHALAHALGHLLSPLLAVARDPLILDLNGDGIHTSNLADSTVHFDYSGDGFAERTAWVSADDGILAIDHNGNGLVDGMAELFGSPTQDGFAVLEALDSNGDGKIDASDAAFASLRVWRDLNQNGVSDPGELMTLAQAGITSISLARTVVGGTNSGNNIGFEAHFTRSDGTTGIAQTIYFAVDRRDSTDSSPTFTAADGVR